MFKIIVRTLILALFVTGSSGLCAKTYSAKEKRELKKLLRSAGVETVQEGLLIRRMEVRNIPIKIATEWAEEISEIHKQGLPVEVIVDRLQQGLIKNIKVGYLARALENLRNELTWGSNLVREHVINQLQDDVRLDSDDRESLIDTVSNLEIASRQGHKRRDLKAVMSGENIDLEMAEKLSELTTVWTNYGLKNKDVIASLKRSIKVGLTVDDIGDIGEKLDSAVAVKKIVRPYDMIKFIWQEIRYQVELKDAEYSYRSGMRNNPNNPSAYGSDIGSIGISTSGTAGSGGVSADVGGGSGGDSGVSVGGGTTSGGTSGETDGGGQAESGESGEAEHGESGESEHGESGESEHGGSGGGEMGGHK